MGTTSKALLGLAVLAAVVLSTQDEPSPVAVAPPDRPAVEQPAVEQPAVDEASAPDSADAARGAAPTDDAGDGLLTAAGDGDGDSWHDTDGVEYRLGLVNTPEANECFGSEATAERRQLTAGGFRAEVYATDAYGRSVTVVRLADGTNLNIRLARRGFADDRYLERFRSEHPALAAELDTAFAAARAERAGLWGACAGVVPQGIADLPPAQPAPPPAQPAPPPQSAPQPALEAAPAPASGECHPDYLTCIPVVGDGSGRGAANDVDCGGLDTAVRTRLPGVDPYRLDGEGDGVGCE